MAGRFREALTDVAETLRRAFRDPATGSVGLALAGPAAHAVAPVSARALAPDFGFRPEFLQEQPLASGPVQAVAFAWEARLQAEAGWAQWAAGAQVCVPDLFQAGACARLEVPPLPRRAGTGTVAPEPLRTRARAGLEALPAPGTRSQACALPAPRAHRALEHVLALPVAFQGVDVASLPKGLWMRYTLKMVRDTGQNIRNLEVLGLYRIPARGSRQINHQAATGRLLVVLGPEALGAPRAPFVLARRKDDGSLVCCFVEEV